MFSFLVDYKEISARGEDILPGETSSCPQQDIPEGDNLIPFVQWICHILVKLKLNYYCSNSLFSLIISIINFILALSILFIPFFQKQSMTLC